MNKKLSLPADGKDTLGESLSFIEDSLGSSSALLSHVVTAKSEGLLDLKMYKDRSL